MMMYNWSQADGFAWYPDEFKYLVTSSFYQGVFNDTYSSALKQYEVLSNLEDPKYDYYKAISMIMKAYHYQLLVDCYGDVPYTEALGRSLNATPVYDDAQTIYEDLIVQLTAAIALIKNADDQDEPGGDDAMFGGDMNKWIKFANSLKLRILVRQSDVSGRGSYITTEMGVIAAEASGFLTQDVAVNPGFIAKEEGKQNVIWDFLGWDASGTQTLTSKATCATDYIIAYLTSTNDTARLNRLYETPKDGHLGVPQGLLDYDTPVVDAFVPEKVSNIGPGILKAANQGAIIFTLAEDYFNQAEAAVKGYLTADPETLYKKGITASFVTLGSTAAKAVAYYSQGIVGYASTADPIEAIITQKWIATNGITAEQAWFDYSRTGYPKNLPISELASTSDRPVRLYYVAGELSSNGDNVPTQPDAFTAKVFWGN
jgi:hypothetical protein